jgi:O-antigen/teichoic acid export membrane protein
MPILAVGLMARAAIGPAERLLNMLGEQRICAVIYATAFAANAGACTLLAPTYGGTGAAIATSAAIVLESALLFLVTRRKPAAGVLELGNTVTGRPERRRDISRAGGASADR